MHSTVVYEGIKCKMFCCMCSIYLFILPWKMLLFCALPTNDTRILEWILLMVLLRMDNVLKNQRHRNVFICGLLHCDNCTCIKRVYIAEKNKILKVKWPLNKFIYIDQDSCRLQPSGCLNSDMFYLGVLWKMGS